MPQHTINITFSLAIYFVWSSQWRTVRMVDNLWLDIDIIVNNFVDLLHTGAVTHYNRYVEPRDGAVSILLSFQQEAVVCMQCIQKGSHCCEG
jgi:hypothetical protein